MITSIEPRLANILRGLWKHTVSIAELAADTTDLNDDEVKDIYIVSIEVNNNPVIIDPSIRSVTIKYLLPIPK